MIPHSQIAARRLSLSLILGAGAVLASGCSDDDPVSSPLDTPFGPQQEVQAYRAQLNAVIDVVNDVQAEVQERAIGSGNVATAQNLNAVYLEVRPRLLEALVELDRMVPPPKLVSLHEEVRLLMILRIDAQGLLIEGFASGDGEPMYEEAETKLAQANALVAGLNSRLCAVDEAINGGACDGSGGVVAG